MSPWNALERMHNILPESIREATTNALTTVRQLWDVMGGFSDADGLIEKLAHAASALLAHAIEHPEFLILLIGRIQPTLERVISAVDEAELDSDDVQRWLERAADLIVAILGGVHGKSTESWSELLLRFQMLWTELEPSASN